MGAEPLRGADNTPLYIVWLARGAALRRICTRRPIFKYTGTVPSFVEEYGHRTLQKRIELEQLTSAKQIQCVGRDLVNTLKEKVNIFDQLAFLSWKYVSFKKKH